MQRQGESALVAALQALRLTKSPHGGWHADVCSHQDRKTP